MVAKIRLRGLYYYKFIWSSSPQGGGVEANRGLAPPPVGDDTAVAALASLSEVASAVLETLRCYNYFYLLEKGRKEHKLRGLGGTSS